MSTENSRHNRQSLIESHLDLVEKIARKAHRVFGPHVDLDELCALGAEGLVQAADRFEEGRGACFATFAGYRIRGAIYDGVGRIAPVTRGKYRQLRAEEVEDFHGVASQAAGVALREESRCEPTPEEELLSQQMKALLERAIDELPEDKRTLVRACYFEHQTLESAGRSIGITKSWASRLHKKALADLRSSLAAA